VRRRSACGGGALLRRCSAKEDSVSGRSALNPSRPTLRPLHPSRPSTPQDVGGRSLDGTSFGDVEPLPFELQVLEAALGEVCRLLAGQALALEAAALPALEDLTRGPDTGNLERVRRIKTQHQRVRVPCCCRCCGCVRAGALLLPAALLQRSR